MTVPTLNNPFAIEKKIEFSTKNNLPIVVLSNEHATVEVSLYGAQILSYIPNGAPDILWLSSKSLFEEGKAIRGGIPICFPWFGPHPSDHNKPQHGFARLSFWQVKSTSVLPEGITSITLSLTESPDTIALWPFSFNAEIIITLSTTLTLTLRCTNTDDKTFEYSDALHSYFNVSDISNITIDGLQNATYYPAGSDIQITQKEKLLPILNEENRRYLNHTATCTILDNEYKRKIQVGKIGSNTTVIWNPAEVVTKTMKDMTSDGYKKFICVEPANAFNDIIKLAPGESFSISTIVESLAL